MTSCSPKSKNGSISYTGRRKGGRKVHKTLLFAVTTTLRWTLSLVPAQLFDTAILVLYLLGIFCDEHNGVPSFK